MSDVEVKNAMEIESLKKDVTEIKGDVKDLSGSMQEIKVLLAGQFVTKDEFEKHKEDEVTARRWWGGTIIGICGLAIATVNLFK